VQSWQFLTEDAEAILFAALKAGLLGLVAPIPVVL